MRKPFITIEELEEKLLSDGEVLVSRFGTFKVIKRNQKRVYHPITKEPFDVPAHHAVLFIPSKTLKREVKALYD